MKYCDYCEEKTETIMLTKFDCNDCRGTGIGYPPPEAKCGRCKGRGYLIVMPYPACSSCYRKRIY